MRLQHDCAQIMPEPDEPIDVGPRVIKAQTTWVCPECRAEWLSHYSVKNGVTISHQRSLLWGSSWRWQRRERRRIASEQRKATPR